MDITDLLPWLIGGGSILITIVTLVCTIVPFIAVFAGIGYFFYRQSQKAKAEREASQSWSRTNGVIVLSRVQVSGGEYTTVTPKIEYEYQVGGQTYRGTQVRAGDRFIQTTSQEAYDTVDRYPKGASVMVYYNPQNPAEAALER